VWKQIAVCLVLFLAGCRTVSEIPDPAKVTCRWQVKRVWFSDRGSIHLLAETSDGQWQVVQMPGVVFTVKASEPAMYVQGHKKAGFYWAFYDVNLTVPSLDVIERL